MGESWFEQCLSADPTGAPPPADPEQIEEHVRRVDHGLNAGLVDVPPTHRNLANLVTPGLREGQELDVEGKAVDPLMSRQASSELAVKELEAALGIPDSSDRQDLYRQVEDPTHEITVPRLCLLD